MGLLKKLFPSVNYAPDPVTISPTFERGGVFESLHQDGNRYYLEVSDGLCSTSERDISAEGAWRWVCGCLNPVHKELVKRENYSPLDPRKWNVGAVKTLHQQALAEMDKADVPMISAYR